MESFMVARILPKQKVLVLNRVSWHDWHTLKSRLLVILIFPKTCSTLHQFTTCRLVPLKLIQWQITRKIIRMPFTSRHSLDKIHERKAHPTVHKHEPSRPRSHWRIDLESYHLSVLTSYDPPQTWWALVDAQCLVEICVSVLLFLNSCFYIHMGLSLSFVIPNPWTRRLVFEYQTWQIV